MRRFVILFFSFYIFHSSLSHTQPVNQSDSQYSPLHWAASQGYIEMVKVLIDKGYDVNARDSQGFTALHYAAASGSLGTVQILVNSGADLYAVNKRNATAMSVAANAGEQKIVDFLFIKMRSSKVEQLRFHTEQQRINSDLVQAAKARAEAERLREQATEWTREAEHWRAEAEKWTREANILKEKQVKIDKMARERYDKILESKQSTEQKYKEERLARVAAERLLREQSATNEAQVRAYEAQNAAVAAQRATDAAIDNLAEEFLRQGMTYRQKSPKNEISFNGYEERPLPVNPSPVDVVVSEKMLEEMVAPADKMLSSEENFSEDIQVEEVVEAEDESTYDSKEEYDEDQYY